jgi:two-component system cell cycle sensor histidine kinase/response regulator CckA
VSRLSILLVEDDDQDALLLERALKRAQLDFELERVQDEPSFARALEKGRDVILTDWSLPAFDGLRVLSLVRERGLDLPVIIVSGTIGEESAVAAMRAGASDFVMKNALARLAPAIQREVRELAARREQRRVEAALREKEQQIQRLQKMDALGRVVAGIAHDFNNLLQTTSGFCELIKSPLSTREVVLDSVREIEGARERGTALVKQMMAFSRNQVLQPTEVDLNAAVRELERMLKSAVGSRVVLRLALAPEPCLVRIDRGQLGQVLLNLAINARDAMPSGGTVTIATSQEATRVVLSVKDTGTGIAPEILPRIFDPFFTTKPVGAGTGLGLSTVYGIVTQSGGEIEATSAPREGACFRLSLPRLVPARTPRSPVILIADDEPQVRSILRTVLFELGATVVEARDGAEALAIAERPGELIDLVITDLAMPRVSGHELIQRLESLRPTTKVLVLSGQGSAEDAPGAAFMLKPFDVDRLVARVRELLTS